MKILLYGSTFLLTLITLILLSGCTSQVSGPTDLEPILCHPEPGVGLLFLTIVNHGHDAEPSTTEVTFSTKSAQVPHVQLAVPTPAVPAKTEIWITVNLPIESGTGSFLQPTGKVTIVADATHKLPDMNRKNNTLITYCNDAA